MNKESKVLPFKVRAPGYTIHFIQRVRKMVERKQDMIQKTRA